MNIEERKEDVGKKIKIIRLSKKLNQENLGKLIECRKDYISRLENGHINPSVGFLHNLANVLGVDIKDFF